MQNGKAIVFSIFCFLIAFCLTVFGDEPTQKEEAPTATEATEPKKVGKQPIWNDEQKKMVEYLTDLFEASKNVNDAKKKGSARKQIERVIDWEYVAKASLGSDHWKKYAGSQKQFQNLLRDIISLTAYTRLSSFWNGLQYEFTDIQIKGNSAIVTADFTTKEGDVETLTYYLKKAKPWLVQDLAYEDMKYSINIFEQVDAFLKEKSFPELIQKLTKRRNELKEEKSTAKASEKL